MKEVWNFHGHVAVPLEYYGSRFIGEAFFSADEIEDGKFIEAMQKILLIVCNRSPETQSFIKKCKRYSDLPATKIPDEVSESLFSEFQGLIEPYKN